MRRLIASALLLFLFAGVSVPLALAVSADPPHACCLRKKPHCHSMSPDDSTGLAFRAPSCANHSCCRALTATHWAQPRPQTQAHSIGQGEPLLTRSNSIFRTSDFIAAHAVRGPPEFSLT